MIKSAPQIRKLQIGSHCARPIERNWQIFARSTARALDFSFHSIRKSKQINTFSHRDALRLRFPAIGVEPPHNAGARWCVDGFRDALLECQLKYAMENIETMNLPVSRSMYRNRCVLQRFLLCSRIFCFLLFFSPTTNALFRPSRSSLARWLKWIFTACSWFVSGATAIKRNSNRLSSTFVNSVLHTRVSLSAQCNEGYRLNVLYTSLLSPITYV